MKHILPRTKPSNSDTHSQPEETRYQFLKNGALGSSLAGSGPSVFAWVVSRARAKQISQEMRSAFEKAGLQSDVWISRIASKGARLIKDIQ